MKNPDTLGILKLVWPLVLIQLAVTIWAVVDISKKKKTRNLSPAIWILISVLGELIGSIAYFIFGRADD